MGGSPQAPRGRKSLRRLVDQLACLRAIGLDPLCAEPPIRSGCVTRAGGARYTAKHLWALSPLRSRASLAATVLHTTTSLTDDGVALFDRAVGRIFRLRRYGSRKRC